MFGSKTFYKYQYACHANLAFELSLSDVCKSLLVQMIQSQRGKEEKGITLNYQAYRLDLDLHPLLCELATYEDFNCIWLQEHMKFSMEDCFKEICKKVGSSRAKAEMLWNFLDKYNLNYPRDAFKFRLPNKYSLDSIDDDEWMKDLKSAMTEVFSFIRSLISGLENLNKQLEENPCGERSFTTDICTARISGETSLTGLSA